MRRHFALDHRRSDPVHERDEGEPAVFVTPRGRRFKKGAWHRYFIPVRSRFGCPDLTPYALRHACTTLLLERGLSPEDVASDRA